MGLFTDILYNLKQKTDSSVRFVIQGDGIPEAELLVGTSDDPEAKASQFQILISNLATISAFIYDARLYIYIPDTNQCFRWSLEWKES